MFTEVLFMIGKKIKYYRLKSGLTSEELATRVGCTKAAISLYESDDREPNAEMIQKLADALGISWIMLLEQNRETLIFNHSSFRKNSKALKKDVEILKYEIESRCSNRFDILNVLGIDDEHIFKPEPLSFHDAPSINADKIRKILGLPPSGPIYSLTNVLEHIGIIVLSFDCTEEIDGLNGTVNGIPYIFFNSRSRTVERQRFTLAHEVCHLFFEFDDLITEKEQEKYINQVAGALLIPTKDIYFLFGKTNRNISIYLRNDVSKVYRIAPSCLVQRLHETGVITNAYHKNFFINLNKNGGRKNEQSQLDSIKDSEVPTIFTQQVYLALSEELITMSKAAEYLNIPLYDVMQNMRVE